MGFDNVAAGPSNAGAERERHLRRGRRLEYFTLGWNILEAIVGIGAGWLAGSIALVGFGVDSLIECTSGAVLLWRLASPAHDESREQLALRLVGASFFLLAAYVRSWREPSGASRLTWEVMPWWPTRTRPTCVPTSRRFCSWAWH
jgi:hypothetical protein